MADPESAKAIRRLLLSGDNTLKNRDGVKSVRRARERFIDARALAADAGDDALLGIIDARLEALGPAEDA